MDNNSLSIAFGDSLTEETVSIVSDLAEIGLDSIMDDGLLKDVPILSTTIALYKIGNSIRERQNIKKLIVFLNEIYKGISSPKKRAEYQQKFNSNDKFKNQQIEYLLVLIDRYISYDKPQMLAKLYMAYLDGTIIWEELTMYAEVVDRFLLLDVETLTTEAEKIIVRNNIGGESVLRLVALGLMGDVTNTSAFVSHGDGGYGITMESLMKTKATEKIYRRTEFGEKLARILR